MKVQTGVSSKDVSVLKELAELEKHQENMQSAKTNEENTAIEAEEQAKNMEDTTEPEKSDVIETLKCAKAKWDNCCLRPDNCCVVKVVRKLTN